MPKKPTYYWDSCIFISVFAQEVRDIDGENVGRDYIASQIVKKEAHLVTSSLTTAEVLRSVIGEDNHNKFKDFLKRDNVEKYQTSDPIWELTHELRDYYRQQNPKISLRTPDAVHLATAIALKADELHTFDDKLKSLSGLVCGKYDIKICCPQMPEGDLFNQQS